MDSFTSQVTDNKDKGKWVKWLGYAGLGLLLYLYHAPILAFVTDLLHLAIAVGAIIGAWLIVRSKTFRLMISTIFEVIFRTITTWFVEWNPIAICERFLRQALSRQAELQDGRGIVEGLVDQIREAIETARKSVKNLFGLVDEATKNLEKEQKKANPDQKYTTELDDNIGVWSADIKRFEEEIEENDKFLNVSLDAQKKIDDNARVCDVTIRNLKGEINSLRRKFKMAQAFSGVMGNIKRILRVNPAELLLYEEAAATVRTKYSAVLGDLKTFTRDMSSSRLQIDLQNAAARSEVLSRLEAIKGKKVLLVTDQSAGQQSVTDTLDKLIDSDENELKSR